MKRIINSKFKFSLSSNLSKKIITIPVRHIKSTAGIRQPATNSRDKIEIEDVVGKRIGKVGVVELNKEHKLNVLTESFMSDIRRSLEAMEIDEDMRVILLKSKYSNAFSMGTDLKYLYYNKLNGDHHKIDKYLESLYNFNYFISVYHKPLLGLCTGEAKGSGVSFLSSCSFPMSTESTEASFPETGLGYTPDGGSIFFLSRLEGELGTFLALTGFPIVHWDLVKLGLTRSFTVSELEEDLATATIGRNFFESMHEYTEKWEETFNKRQEDKTKNNFNNMHSHLNRDELKKLNLINNNEPFKYPWEREEADKGQNAQATPFHSMIEKDIQANKEFNFKDHKGRYFNDSTENFMEIVFNKIPRMGQRYFSLAHVVKDINRLFRFDTVKEIYDALQEENSYFSEFCLSSLDKKSPLSLEVTLKMLRNARKMNYTEIIKQEINVAKNMILKNKDFDLIMQNRISHSKDKVKFSKSLSQITTQDVDEIFQDSNILSNIKLDMKDNSLLPHNRYFDKYPECFRLWINENPRVHGDIRANFDYEIKHFMIEKLGIDLRDSNVTIDQVRKIISKIETNQHAKDKNNSKFSNLLSDPKFMRDYFTKRQEVISRYENNKVGLKNVISSKMKKLFEENLINVNKSIHTQCRDIREIEKRRTYLRLKRWLFMNRIMEYKTRRKIINSNRVNALGAKSFFIPKNDMVSYRDEINPDLKNSPFYQLVGLFTLKTISPEYALKFSTTDPNKDILTHLEVNAEKLKEIKEQLRKNPKKFLEVWDSVYDKEAEEEFDQLDEKSFAEYERVYRMRHEGHSTLDKLPYYKEYQDMKNKWHDIKNRTTEMLKKFTHNLVTEIIQNENLYDKNLKQNAEDDTGKELEKYEDIRALYKIVSGEKSELEEFYNETNSKSSTIDRVNILKQNINNSITNDPFYQKLNQLIKDAEKSQDIEMKEFLSNFNKKVFELTQNLVMTSLLDGVEGVTHNTSKDSDSKMAKSFTQEQVQSNLIKLFNIEKSQDDSNNYSGDSEFINWLYLKYGTQNIFSEILKKSKFSIIYLLKNQIENELFNHNNTMLSKIKESKIDVVRAIYNKEKSLLEDVLKNYFETKLNLLNLDLIEKKEIIEINKESSENFANSITMENVIDTLKEISFCHILLNNSEKVPQSLNSIFSKFEEAHNEKTLIELYVNVQEIVSTNSIGSDTEIEKNIKNLFNHLTKEMKKSEWFAKLTILSGKENSSNENVNLDRKIEDFMKKRFNEIIYSNGTDSKNDVDYYIDMRKIQDMLKEKFDVFSLNNLIKDYKNDKISLVEENYTTGIFSDLARFNEKKGFYSLKLKLTEKLNKLENQFNIENLKKKYSDYLFNADFYIHKILCNVKNPEEIFTEKIQDSQKFGKFLFEIKNTLDETYFDLPTNTQANANSFNHMTRLKTILFNQKEYIVGLENLKSFIENKAKYNSLIEKELLGILDFVAKYEVKLLLNDIQTDSERLYNFLVSELNNPGHTGNNNNKKILIEKKDFIITEEEFHKEFSKVQLDELIGLEGSNLEYLNELNKRMKEIVKNQLAQMNENKHVQSEVIIDVEHSSTGLSLDNTNHNQKLQDFSSKISSTIKGLKTIQSIKKIENENNKSFDFKEYVKTIENPGINFSRMMDTLLGRQFSLQEFIIDDKQKTLYDYLQDNTFDPVFSKKIPVDLVKCAVQVLDGRLIKALKLILSSELQKEFSLNDFIQYTGNNNYLQFRPGYFTDEEAHVYSEFLGDLEDFKVEYRYIKDNVVPEEEMEGFEKAVENLHKTADNMERFLTEFKKVSIATTKGDKIFIKYKKGSIFNNILNIHKLDPEKKKILSDKIIRKLQEIVPFPDLSSQYTLLKYVYDYHMGNLQSFYENNRSEAETRVINLNNVLFLEKVERMEKYDKLLADLYPEKNFLNPNTINNEEDPRKEFNAEKLKINFEKELNLVNEDYEKNPSYSKSTEHLYNASNKEEKKLIDKSRNLAYSIFVSQSPKDWHLAIEKEKNPHSKEILRVELDYYFKIYHNMHLTHKGEKDKVFQDRKVTTMLLTEEFRAKSAKVKSDNEKMRNNEFNLNNQGEIGLNHLLNQDVKTTTPREAEYYKVLDDMFGEYLKNKKEKFAYTKEKILEQKEKFSQMDNIRVLNPYELISNSQEAYIDMKSGKINDDKFKMSIQSFLKWNNLNKEYAVFDATDLTDIVDLDNAASRAVSGKYSSIPSDLVDLADEDPDAQFKNKIHAVDKNEEEWFEEQIEEILSEFLNHRKDVEKYLTRDQLKALDEDLMKNFTHNNFIDRVKQNLNRETLSMNYMNDVFEHMRNSKNDKDRQDMKFKNNQYEFNKNLKDENAYYQNVAYQLRNDKEYMDRIDEDVRKKKKLGRSLKPDKKIDHPLADDQGWKSLYFNDLLNAQLFNKNRVEDKHKTAIRMNANEVNSLDKSTTYEGITPNQKFNHMKTIVEQAENNSDRISGMYRRKANEVLGIMREKSERLDKLNDFLNSNKIGKLH